eukprot:TRINITY_DN1609_c1_g2_i1.p1 TRINITY_DN1609_c1_g2~~TRINITY_DN1609_c1_g2_i1.p1  ORF type:complete len:1189 (+),score=295.33 TRINITY_DN1609_c1_g2_i1:49-3615(+)
MNESSTERNMSTSSSSSSSSRKSSTASSSSSSSRRAARRRRRRSPSSSTSSRSSSSAGPRRAGTLPVAKRRSAAGSLPGLQPPTPSRAAPPGQHPDGDSDAGDGRFSLASPSACVPEVRSPLTVSELFSGAPGDTSSTSTAAPLEVVSEPRNRGADAVEGARPAEARAAAAAPEAAHSLEGGTEQRDAVEAVVEAGTRESTSAGPLEDGTEQRDAVEAAGTRESTSAGPPEAALPEVSTPAAAAPESASEVSTPAPAAPAAPEESTPTSAAALPGGQPAMEQVEAHSAPAGSEAGAGSGAGGDPEQDTSSTASSSQPAFEADSASSSSQHAPGDEDAAAAASASPDRRQARFEAAHSEPAVDEATAASGLTARDVSPIRRLHLRAQSPTEAALQEAKQQTRQARDANAQLLHELQALSRLVRDERTPMQQEKLRVRTERRADAKRARDGSERERERERRKRLRQNATRFASARRRGAELSRRRQQQLRQARSASAGTPSPRLLRSPRRAPPASPRGAAALEKFYSQQRRARQPAAANASTAASPKRGDVAPSFTRHSLARLHDEAGVMRAAKEEWAAAERAKQEAADGLWTFTPCITMAAAGMRRKVPFWQSLQEEGQRRAAWQAAATAWRGEQQTAECTFRPEVCTSFRSKLRTLSLPPDPATTVHDRLFRAGTERRRAVRTDPDQADSDRPVWEGSLRDRRVAEADSPGRRHSEAAVPRRLYADADRRRDTRFAAAGQEDEKRRAASHVGQYLSERSRELADAGAARVWDAVLRAAPHGSGAGGRLSMGAVARAVAVLPDVQRRELTAAVLPRLWRFAGGNDGVMLDAGALSAAVGRHRIAACERAMQRAARADVDQSPCPLRSQSPAAAPAKPPRASRSLSLPSRPHESPLRRRCRSGTQSLLQHDSPHRRRSRSASAPTRKPTPHTSPPRPCSGARGRSLSAPRPSPGAQAAPRTTALRQPAPRAERPQQPPQSSALPTERVGRQGTARTAPGVAQPASRRDRSDSAPQPVRSQQRVQAGAAAGRCQPAADHSQPAAGPSPQPAAGPARPAAGPQPARRKSAEAGDKGRPGGCSRAAAEPTRGSSRPAAGRDPAKHTSGGRSEPPGPDRRTEPTERRGYGRAKRAEASPAPPQPTPPPPPPDLSGRSVSPRRPAAAAQRLPQEQQRLLERRKESLLSRLGLIPP